MPQAKRTDPQTADTPAPWREGVALGALFDRLEVRFEREADRAIRVRCAVESSADAEPGSLFIARRGAREDGRAHIADALARGAVAILAHDAPLTPEAVAGLDKAREGGAAIVFATDAARVGAIAIERAFGEPSRGLRVIGVTGTNGKTTVAWLIRRLLDGAGVPTGLISTVGVAMGVESRPATHTTPPASAVSRALRRMLDAGCQSAALEASSHALAQGRLAGVRFAGGVFTNITGDHLDYHGSMEAYADAKASLFAGLPRDGFAIVNADDPAAARMVRDCSCRAIACALGDVREPPRDGGAGVAPARVRVRSADARGAEVELEGPWGAIHARSQLIGEHNAMNLLEAVAAAHALGAPTALLERAIPDLDAPPGRFERVAAPESAGAAARIAVLVDYAHTDDALLRALSALRRIAPAGGRLIVVFGAGGDRDRTKRPRMGAVAERLADVVYVTSDNPRTEDPDAIIAEALAGMTQAGRGAARAIADRERAIFAAIEEARPGDIVLIAGKGHEDYQILPDGRGGTITRAFDDRVVARAALAQRASQTRERVA